MQITEYQQIGGLLITVFIVIQIQLLTVAMILYKKLDRMEISVLGSRDRMTLALKGLYSKQHEIKQNDNNNV